MRNLKRALSLALATVMTLGLMVVGTGAVGYTDVTSEDNQEAIEVLQAVGIMTGVTDDEFNPDGVVTRNQMAVIMSQLLNLDYDYYRGINPFTDVPAWAAPYVAACVAEGVTAGIGGGLYGGENNVTAAQAALMIMKALGYFQYQGDFNPDWQVATVRQASYIGLFNGVDANAEQALTRGQVAQLVLNGLEATMVTFTGTVGTELTLPDGTKYTAGYVSEYSYRTGTAEKYNTLGYGKTDISDQGQYYIQLGEELYDGDLRKSGDEDDFMRPSTTWRYDHDVIGTYVNDPDLTYTASVELGDIYADLGLTERTPILEQYVDGREVPSAQLQDLSRRDDTKLNNGGKGVLTQVWYDEDDDGDVTQLTITNINTYVATVRAVQNDNDEDRSISLDTYTKAPTPLSNKFETQDFEADDLVTYTAAYNGSRYEIKTVEPLTASVSGTLTEWNGTTADINTGKSESNFTVAGETYEYSNKYVVVNEDGGESEVWNFEVDETELNVYVDDYGYAIYVDGVEAEKNYAVVIGVGSTNPYGDETTGVTLMLPDGTLKTATAKLATDSEPFTGPAFVVGGANRQTVDDPVGDIVTYKIDDDGVYELTVAGTVVSGSNPATLTGHSTNVYAVANEVQFLNGRSLFVLDDAGNAANRDKTLFATEDTIFVVATEKNSGTGYNYDVYIGYENMPSIDSAVGTDAVAYVTNSEYSTQLDIVYIATERLAGMSGVDTYFVKEKNEKIITNSTGSYYVLPAIVDGVKTEIKVDATRTYVDKSGNPIDFTKNSTVYGLFAITNVVENKDGIITSFVDVTGDVFDARLNGTKGTTANTSSSIVGTVRVASGVLGIGEKGDKDKAEYYAYDSNTVAYYVDKDYKDIDVINVTSIANDTNDYVYGIQDDDVPTNYKKLSEVVIVEQEDSTVETHTVSITGANGNAWVDEVNGTHYANQTSITVEDGEDFQFKLAPVAGKKVVSVKVGSTELTPDVNGVYTVSNVTGDITVDVTCGNVLKLTVTNNDDAAITVAVNGNAPEAVANSASTAGNYEVTNGQVVTVTIVYSGTTPVLTGTTNAVVIPVSEVSNSVTYQVYIGNTADAPVVTFSAS